MRRYHLALAILVLLSGCATELNPRSLTKIENSDDTITVTRFRCCDDKDDLGLEAGTYHLEYENKDGLFYRGSGVVVKLPAGLNFNKGLYPDNLFEGGVYIPKDPNAKDYRIYYYQNNLPGSPGPETTGVRGLQMEDIVNRGTPGSNPTAPSPGTTIGTGIGLGITDAMVSSSRGSIALMGLISKMNVRENVSRP